jgi:hypothetical protein
MSKGAKQTPLFLIVKGNAMWRSPQLSLEELIYVNEKKKKWVLIKFKTRKERKTI